MSNSFDNGAMMEFVSAVRELAAGKNEDKRYLTGTVSHTDLDGTVWVNVAGGVSAMPVSRSTASYSPGDVVSFSIENGVASMGGNVTDPAAGGDTVVHMTKQVDIVENHVERIERVKADRVETDILNAAVADIETAMIGKADVDDLTAAEARIGNLEADHVSTTDLQAANAQIEQLQAADVTITGKLTAAEGDISQLQADTADIDTIRANSAKVQNLTASELEADHATVGTLDTTYATIANLNAATGRIDDLEADHVSTTDLQAVNGEITNLKAKDVTIEGNISAATGRIDDLEADHVSTTDLQATNARIGTIEADYLKAADMTAEQARVNNLLAGKATVNDLNAATGRITQLESADARITGRLDAAEADIDDLEAEDARIANLVAGKASINDLNAATGRITVLESTKANIADIEANYITADDIEATYMHADMTNSDVAWIQNGVIANGAISSAMINDVSANKLTAGTINGSVINVTNLNADNITAGTINGQRIGTGSLSLDKLSENVYTEAEVDAKLSDMQAEIDGAIETWTGTAAPTLNNAPASAWTTTADRDKHVGDVYFNTTSGYNYRFTKSGSTYSWLQIKDTDITNALQRIQTAEGQITQFDSDISTLKTDTGELKTKTQSLETSLGDKVDTTTFNELEDTVDGHSQTISQHTTAISNKADTSTVNQVTNRVTKAEQDISGINTTIGQLQTTVEGKADGSTVTTISNKLNTVSDTVDGHTQTLSSVTSTQTTIQQTAVKSTVQLWHTKADTTAPGKPTSHISTNDASKANQWNLAVPTYNASYPNYFYCYEYQYLDGSYGWSAVTRDIATGESQQQARKGVSDAAAAQSTANTASANASNAVSTANTAKTTADGAASDASTALSTANTAASDASTAKTNAASAVSTANSASSTATTAKNTADTAKSTADTAKSTADKNVRESQQLWFTKANSTAPGKPTSKVTSIATTGNAWTTKVPTYNASYPYYFYCVQYIAADGTVTWSDVVYDQATTEAQSVARTATTNLATLRTEYNETKTTVAGTVTRLGTVEQTANGVRSDLDNLSIGGRNLIRNTNQGKTGIGNASGNATTTVSEIDIEAGRKGWRVDISSASTNWYFIAVDISHFARGMMVNDPGGQYAVSFSIRSDGGGNFDNIVVVKNGNATNETTYAHRFNYTAEDNGSWKRIQGVLTVFDNPVASEQVLYINVYNIQKNATYIELKDIKLEKGNVATAWTPAPEDLETEVTTLKTDYANYKQTTTEALSEIGTTYATKTELGTETSNRQTAIQQLNDTISSKANASDVYTKTDVNGLISTEVSNRNSAIQQSAENITATVSSTYATKTELSEAAANIKSHRFTMRRDNWSEATWATYIVGKTDSWVLKSPTANGTAVLADATTLRVGDTFSVVGVSTDKSITHSIVNEVTAVPSSAAANASAKVIAVDDNAASVTSLESTITQQAGQISLRATKTEVTEAIDNIEVGVRNLAVRTHAEYPAIHSTDEWSEWITPPTGTNRCYAESFFIYPSEYLEVGDEFVITIDIEWTKFTASGGNLVGARFQTWANGLWSGFVNPITSNEQVTAAEFLAGDGSKTIVMRGTIREDTKMYPGNYWKYNFRTDNSDGTGKYRVRHFALRKGNKVTNWTPAPEDQAAYTDSQVTSAKAEIKVTTDGITSEVEKKTDKASIISTIRQSAETVKIKASQVEIDGTAIFSAISDDVDDAITDKGYQTASQVNSAITSKGYATTTQVSTAKSEAISAAASDATSKANAAQTAATNAANQATDTKLQSYSTTTQMNAAIGDAVDAIEVGGRNLLKWTAEPTQTSTSWNRDPASIDSWSRWSTYWNTERTDCGIKGTLVLNGASTVSGFVVPLVTENAAIGGVDYVLSFDYRTNASTTGSIYLLCASGGNAQIASRPLVVSETEWQHFSAVLNWPSTEGKVTRGLLIPYFNRDGAWLEIHDGSIKLEKGNKATDWSPAPEDATAAISAVQDNLNATRSWYAECSTAAAEANKVATITPATTDFTLSAGATVYVKFTVTNSAAVANLTMNVNGTGAKPLKTIRYDNINTIAGVGYLRAGITLQLYYDGTNWITNENYNADTQNRTRWQNILAASEAITAGHVICGTASGYRDIAAGVSFDLSYPLLYAATSIAKGATTGTRDNNYLQVNSVSATNNSTVEGAAIYKTIFLKGAVSGNTFTIAASPFLTCNPPTATTDPTVFYIPIGMLYSTTAMYFNSTKDLYAFIDGKFRQVTPTEIVATQRVYYRSKTSGTFADAYKPTAWVTQSADKYNADTSTANGWSTKVTPIAASKDADSSGKYLYLYTCEQRKRLDGTVEHTDILLDDSTTIIDGGNIITGSIAANKLDVYDATIQKIRADAIDTASITVGQDQVDGLDETLTELIPTSLGQLQNDMGYVDASFMPDNIPVANINGQLTVDKIDVDSLRAALLQVASLLIGNESGCHIEASGQRMSFKDGKGNEVAYIAVDANGKSTFYMTRSMVVEDMQFGSGLWKWYKRDNNNMSLKWMGNM